MPTYDNNWALLLGVDGNITEGTGDNFFIVKDGEVVTPKGKDILRGISREYVISDLCPELSIPVVEKDIDPYDVYAADEAFMTGTPFCMLPVTSLNGLLIGDGKVGEIFSKIIDFRGAYIPLSNCDFRVQKYSPLAVK